MSKWHGQFTHTRYIVLTVTLFGITFLMELASALRFCLVYSSMFSSTQALDVFRVLSIDRLSYRSMYIGEYILNESALNLEQAITASCHRLACRVVGERRVIVDCGRQPLTIQVQHRSKRHWVTDDHGGGVRYLAGILRDGAGSYVCLSNDLTNIAQVRAWLPAHHQALLLPDCDDWQAMQRGDV